MSEQARPYTILITALGGEGGGVLADWLSEAAVLEGLAVQRTSIPGVAQRTGATSYYLEIYPTPLAHLNGQRPVLSLYPQPGNVDLLVSTELLEAGRMMLNGFVTPDRTTLVTSTHRIFTVQEKSGASDGRIDGHKIFEAAKKFSHDSIMFDMSAVAKEAGSIINAVVLGAMAASNKLPVNPESLIEAIKASGKAVEANLRGFEAGRQGVEVTVAATRQRPRLRSVSVAETLRRVGETFPRAVHGFVNEGVTRLADYQNIDYAEIYLDRLETIRDLDRDDYQLTNEVARYLALWMAFQDLIRVAQQKSHRDRFERVRAEVRAKPDEPLIIVEYLKPGIEEFCSVLPSWLARPILNCAARKGSNYNIGMHVKSNTIFGFLQLYLLTKLRPFRPYTYRFKEENERIEAWLSTIQAAAAEGQQALALEIAQCAGLIKGYGDTYNRGLADYQLIVEQVIKPALSGKLTGQAAVDAVKKARLAVLSDPDGETPDSRTFDYIPLSISR
jgi:indolepyruvate ferredoxin oxidoreductase beta subunit